MCRRYIGVGSSAYFRVGREDDAGIVSKTTSFPQSQATREILPTHLGRDNADTTC